MCILHKGYRGFRALSPASILGGYLIGLKSAIPFDTIHSTLFLKFQTKIPKELKAVAYKSGKILFIILTKAYCGLAARVAEVAPRSSKTCKTHQKRATNGSSFFGVFLSNSKLFKSSFLSICDF